jgi:hypothetical protein
MRRRIIPFLMGAVLLVAVPALADTKPPPPDPN